MLDRDLRTRLRALAENDARLLAPESQARVLKRIVTDGPALVRRARVERTAALGGGLALAAAAVLLLVVGVPSFAAPSSAAPSLEKMAQPEVSIALPAGRMTVSTAELGGAEVRVATPQGNIFLHEGLLAVETNTHTLAVEVADGSAVLHTLDATQHEVRAGTRIELSPGGITKRALGAAKVAALRRAVAPR
jgi:hypothetical protein